LFLACAGCYAGVDGGRGGGGDPIAMDDPDTGVDEEPTRDTAAAGEESSESGEAETGAVDDSAPDDLDALERPCAYALVHEQPGVVLAVEPDASELEVQPLQAGEGFYCMRVEFDMQTLDNLEQLAAEHDACPQQTAIAAVYGSAPQGEFIGSAFFGHYDDTCARGQDTLEVGNFLHFTPDTAGPWPPGERWHVVLEMRPFASRVSLSRDGEQVGPRVEASLFPASIDDTRDPVVRLGQSRITAGRFFPWYGATYENLVIHADVAPAPTGS
jgi:hypothetical protein